METSVPASQPVSSVINGRSLDILSDRRATSECTKGRIFTCAQAFDGKTLFGTSSCALMLRQ